MAKVNFLIGTQAEYNACSKDQYALYWITDTQRLYKGDLLFAVGAEASTTSAGLLSAADKTKLDNLVEGAIVFRGVYDSLAEVAEPKNGDLVIVGSKEYVYSTEDNKWHELGDEGLYLTISEAAATYETKEHAIAKQLELENAISATAASIRGNSGVTRFEVRSAIPGLLVSDGGQNDMRIYVPADTEYEDQQVGAGGNPDRYYLTIRAYAPNNNIKGCRKGSSNSPSDFADMEAVHVDEGGRVYADFWLPIAKKQDGEWVSFANSERYVGWNQLIEWYDDDTIVSDAHKVAIAVKRISLVNTTAQLYNTKDWYVTDLEKQLTNAIEGAVVWGSIAE